LFREVCAKREAVGVTIFVTKHDLLLRKSATCFKVIKQEWIEVGG